MSKFLAALALAVVAFAATAETSQQNEAAVRAKMRELAGPAARACGYLHRGGSLQPAWKCAQDSDRAHRPFWLALEGARTDSAVWHAIARGPAGKRYVVFYTSNDAGQSEFVPSFTVTACNEPFRLFKDDLFILRCSADVP